VFGSRPFWWPFQTVTSFSANVIESVSNYSLRQLLLLLLTSSTAAAPPPPVMPPTSARLSCFLPSLLLLLFEPLSQVAARGRRRWPQRGHAGRGRARAQSSRLPRPAAAHRRGGRGDGPARHVGQRGGREALLLLVAGQPSSGWLPTTPLASSRGCASPSPMLAFPPSLPAAALSPVVLLGLRPGLSGAAALSVQQLRLRHHQ
jgi:hypothetical protein